MIIVSVLAPRTYAKVGIEEALIQFKAGKRIIPTADLVKQLIQTLLDEALNITIAEVKEWINRFVPKREGDLRVSLIKFLERSIPPIAAIGELRGIRLVLGVGADIPYAKYVDEMTTKQVRHSGTWREHSGKRAYSKGHRAYLYDPQAVGNYHDKMVVYAKQRLKTNIDKATYKFNSGA